MPKKFKPVFGGIIKDNAKSFPTIFFFKPLKEMFLYIVGPAGLEPATDGL